MRASSTFADLVFHGLAFVPPSAGSSPASRAASLYDPTYLTLVKSHMDADAWAPLAEDAPVLSRLFEPVHVAHAVGLFAILHRSIDELMATARKSLRELGPIDVASALALEGLRSSAVEPMEIFRAAISLSARAFERAHASLLADRRDAALAVVRARLAELGAPFARVPFEHVALSATLGARGRGYGTSVIVGAAGLASGERGSVDADSAIVLAVHELAVHAATEVLEARGYETGWADVEPLALRAQEELVRGSALEPAYRSWAARLDRSGLSNVGPERASLTGDVLERLTSAERNGTPKAP